MNLKNQAGMPDFSYLLWILWIKLKNGTRASSLIKREDRIKDMQFLFEEVNKTEKTSPKKSIMCWRKWRASWVDCGTFCLRYRATAAQRCWWGKSLWNTLTTFDSSKNLSPRSVTWCNRQRCLLEKASHGPCPPAQDLLPLLCPTRRLPWDRLDCVSNNTKTINMPLITLLYRTKQHHQLNKHEVQGKNIRQT